MLMRHLLSGLLNLRPSAIMLWIMATAPRLEWRAAFKLQAAPGAA
jgi:hypothetical protein